MERQVALGTEALRSAKLYLAGSELASLPTTPSHPSTSAQYSKH